MSEETLVLLKSNKNNGYFTWRPVYIFLYLAQFFVEWEMFQTKVDKIKTVYIILFSKVAPIMR